MVYQNDNTMKLLFTLMMMAVALFSNAQAIELRAGHSMFPADHVSLAYEHYTNSNFNLAGRIGFERARTNGLVYSAYTADAFAQSAFDPERVFSIRYGLGLTASLETEPYAYKDWKVSRRFTAGILGEVSGNWSLSEIFSLSLFAQQKLLYNSALGRTRFLIGLGISYHFPNL